jgi:UDP-glucuronate decarboxylase
MKILVTGAAGFLGSNLVDCLLGMGHEVIGVDNLCTGSISNLRQALASPKFQFVQQDVVSPLEFNCDGIFNLACPASPIQYQIDPVKTITTNVLGALNVLNLARKNNCRVLPASTSEGYGDPLVHPQSEEYWGNVNPIGPRACYDEGKRAAETLFTDYFNQYQVDIRIVRIFNTYGPRMAKDDGRVVSNFVVSSLQNSPLTIYGNGNQTRSFCYVSDLIDGLISVFFGPDYHKPVNLGSPYELTMIDLAMKVIAITNSKSTLELLPLPVDDPSRRKPDISKAREIFSWSPSISPEDGLKETAEYFARILKLEKSVESSSS